MAMKLNLTAKNAESAKPRRISSSAIFAFFVVNPCPPPRLAVHPSS